MKFFILLSVFLVFSNTANASEYDFDAKSRNHMRGAYMMCSTTGFQGGDCPSIFTKCWKPPMIYRKKHKIKTYCVDSPSFTSTQEDADKGQAEAKRRLEQNQ